ncbi:MAG: mechanosensitive ion channel family protein, partial [Oscillospiraceae bacterium]|nr:mechanosensitive ion channel family protein [Oscillospiraceae bacterium]
TLRHTVIRTFENKRLIIPNSDMNKAAIENSSYGDSKVCFPLEFSITYESDADAAMQVIRNAIQRHPKYDEDKAEEALAAGRDPVEVLVNRLESSGIVLKVWVWAESLGVSNRMKSDIYLEVRRRFGFAGVDFAYLGHWGADKKQTPPPPAGAPPLSGEANRCPDRTQSDKEEG